ncbi:FapA family protein [Lachnospiraceae bacterium KK002]
MNSRLVRKYEAMGFDKGQVEEIRQGLEKGLDVSWYTSVNYDWFQMEEIKKGLERGLDVSVYARPEISYDRMRQIRKGLKEGVDLSGHQELEAGYLRQIRKAKMGHVDIFSYIEAGYEPDQLEEIRLGLEHKADISRYLIKEFLGESLREIRLGVEEGLDVSVYARIYFGWQQMREIRLGLERRVDVSLYAKELYRWQQMREIRLGLEKGLDVSAYKSLMYSAREMRQIRMKMQEQARQVEQTDFQIELLEEQARQASECVVTVSRDRMEVYVTLEKGTSKSKNEIMRLLARENVVFGIKQDEIEKNLKEAEQSTRRFLAAEGVRPERGRDGYYEYFFRTGIPQIPAVRQDGSIDYQNTVYFEQVKAGQVIAVYHEAQPGIGGRTVDGTELPAQNGQEKQILKGRGFLLSQDKKTYIARESGKIELKNNEITIQPLLVVTEVTISTGNLRFNGSIWVKGNVGSGVVIQSKDELIIEGNVEAARLQSGKRIVIKNGVSGGGMAVIESAEDIHGKFFEGATLTANGGIYANYVMNSNLIAGKEIEISGSKGAIIGGNAAAVNGIKAHHIGNRAGLLTNISLGVSKAMIEKEEEAEIKLKKLQSELEIFEEAYRKLQKQYPLEVRNEMELYLKVEQATYIKRKQMEQQVERTKELEEKRKKANEAKMMVYGILNAGTAVQMNGLQWTAASSVRNVTVRLSGKEIGVFRN